MSLNLSDPRMVPPRRVVRRAGTWWTVHGNRIWIWLILAGGVAMISTTIIEAFLLLFAPPVPATIIGCTSESGGKGGVRYRATYLYHPSDLSDKAALVKGSDRISVAEFDVLYRHRAILIHAAVIGPFRLTTLDRPRDIYIRDRWFGWAFGTLWFTLMAGFGYSAWMGPKRQQALLRDGETVTGRIFSKDIHKGKSTTYSVRYEYQPAGDGQPTIFRKMGVKKREYERAMVGQEVRVFYDVSKPRRSVVYEYCDYEFE